MSLPRPEYPRPQMIRDNWMNLNGTWEFAFDDQNTGLLSQWHLGSSEFPLTIVVPYPYQSALSGHGTNAIHDVVWYRRTFATEPLDLNQSLLLHFGAVDYEAHVWLNGKLVAHHEGGHTPFTADITDCIVAGDNVLVVRAEDVTERLDQPRGKQYWGANPTSIFYTRTTGIWQTVWLEKVPRLHLEDLKITPDMNSQSVQFHCQFAGLGEARKYTPMVEIQVFLRGDVVAEATMPIRRNNLQVHLALEVGLREGHEILWSPEHPNLFDVVLTVRNGDDQPPDVVTSYFGLRAIEIKGGKILLNHRPYYFKLVLDQGYYPDGILTPPTDDAIKHDVELIKELGFNGARKHQKVEDPRYLYWCDHLGLIVWGEMANCYAYSEGAVQRMTQEWQEVIHRDYNHPCIVAWVPINESWGVPNLLEDSRQRAHCESLYYLTRSLDATRLVMSNDGWEHTQSDLITIHDYEPRKEVLKARYQDVDSALQATPGDRLILCDGYPYQGQPILVTEFGGIAFNKDRQEGWGYSEALSEDDFIARYQEVTQALLESPSVQGYCYTQLTDVEQETNGLLTYNREPKVPIDIIRSINQGRHGK